MSRLIDADALYERICDLEAQALSYVGKIGNDEAMKEDWRIWSAILTERTAFKHDIIDAPTIEERKTGKWITVDYFAEGKLAYREWECSACGCVVEDEKPMWNFCPNCGAKMGEGEEYDR